MSSETRLRHQKKASAVTSLAGGTAGLAGLGLLALKKPKPAAAATTIGGGIGGVGAYNFASIQNQESKKRVTPRNVYVVRNKKQIKSIKSGLEPVTKGLAMMDFGLSDVHQGEAELISKKAGDNAQSRALDKHAKKRQNQANAAGAVGSAGLLGAYGANIHGTLSYLNRGTPTPGQQASALHQRGKEGIGGYRSARAGAYTGGTKIPRRKMVKPMAKFAAKSIKANPHGAGVVAGLGVGAAGIAGSIPFSSSAAKHKQQAQDIRVENRKVLAKALRVPSWTNPRFANPAAATVRSTAKTKTHQLGAPPGVHGTPNPVSTKPNNTKRNALIGGGLLTAGGAGTAYTFRGSDLQRKQRAGREAMAKSASSWIPRTTSRVRGEGVNRIGVTTRHAANNPFYRIHQKAEYSYASGRKDTVGGGFRVKNAGKGALAGVGATAAGSTALTVNRKSKESIAKAYNPEAKRDRRMDHAATSMAVGAGAAGGGAGVMASRARDSYLGAKKEYHAGMRSEGVRRTKVRSNSVKWNDPALHTGQSAKHFVAAKKGLGTGVRQAAKAGALGVGAVGLAVGADQVRRYKGNKGSTYKPLSRITAS